jgi:hypothetical protein
MDKRQTVLAAVLGLLAVAAAGGYWWSTQQEEAPAPVTTMPKPHRTATSGPADMAGSGDMTAMPGAMSGVASGPMANGVHAMATATSGHMPGAASSKPLVSDAIALSEEELDKLKQEHKDLDSRAQDLQSQVHDGKALIDMKQKQIDDLKAQLKTASKGK